MQKTSPIEFFKQVRQEINKISWPTQKEVVITGVMVLIMVLISAIFFLIVDLGASKLIQSILSLGTWL
jgi:preprotein translocase subunit SecE